MPTINVARDLLFERLGRTYTQEEFDEFLFEFGLELDDVVDPAAERAEEERKKRADMSKSALRKLLAAEKKAKAQAQKESPSSNAAASSSSSSAGEDDDEILYKVDLPANRYDLLCLEGLARALNYFNHPDRSLPAYRVADVDTTDVVMRVDRAAVSQVRGVVVCGVLRNVTLSKRSVKSFMELQDKLHHNIGRQRTLVSIGTHDMDAVKAPFRYTTRAPEDIRFVALGQSVERNASELFAHIEANELHLKPYLQILSGEPRYPVIEDADGVVLSLPPIINSERSKITTATRNIFVEVTAIDNTKAHIVLNTVLALFSEYCDEQYTAHAVRIVVDDDGDDDGSGEASAVTPVYETRTTETRLDYVNRALGLALSADDVVTLLRRMMLPASASDDGSAISVQWTPVRSDIMHACDVMEDVGIAYGYNRLDAVPPPTLCAGKQQPRNLLTERLRVAVANAGFTEILTFSLVPAGANTDKLRRSHNNSVVLANPMTVNTAEVRTTLLTGALMTFSANRSEALPVRLFEISDVVLRDDTVAVGARNELHLVALFAGTSSGFEIIHGLLDRIMLLVEQPWNEDAGYSLRPSTDNAFLEGRRADVILGDGNTRIGSFGIVHPDVAANFDVRLPCSALEISLEHFVPK
jgi:phenylalanyl-tRNA synthetase beta chain